MAFPPEESADVTNERFAALVQRLQREAAAQPAAYRLRVRLLAYLGYVYIGTVLAAVGIGLLLLGYIFTLHLTGANWILAKVGWVLLLFAVIIVRALFVSFPPPDGIALQRRQAPALFVLVDHIAHRLRSPGQPGRIAASSPRSSAPHWRSGPGSACSGGTATISRSGCRSWPRARAKSSRRCWPTSWGTSPGSTAGSRAGSTARVCAGCSCSS